MVTNINDAASAREAKATIDSLQDPAYMYINTPVGTQNNGMPCRPASPFLDKNEGLRRYQSHGVGERVVDSRGRVYLIASDGSLRRLDKTPKWMTDADMYAGH